MTTFDFDGEKYREASNHQKEWGSKLISELKLDGTEHILDLGCGDGTITALLSKHVPNGYVVGIDASKGMINTAKKTYKLDNIDFKLLDINTIRYLDKFDIVVSNAALHWIKNHKQLLANIYMALKNNGIVRFNFAANENCSNFLKAIKRIIKYPRYKKYFKDFIWPWYMPKINEYKLLMGQSLFSEIKVWGENADRNFPDKETMIKWIDQPSIVPFLMHIKEKDKKEFRDTVIKQMIEETSQPEGTCFETFRRINVLAKK
ncbi:MAG: methyltransferase type 11 [Gammaproteobacteria bacterium]|nr:MAG: methyltransferase type 11 [Gammaproteobacteria bacterium]